MGGGNKVTRNGYRKFTRSLGKLVVRRGKNSAKAHTETKEVVWEWPSC
jgi:hypothetical protein